MTVYDVLLLFLILAVAGVVTYLGVTFKKDLVNAQDSWKKVDDKVASETNDRLANVTYVVDQVNHVNGSIYKATMSNQSSIGSLNSSVTDQMGKMAATTTGLRTDVDVLKNGFNTFLSFSSSATPGAPSVAFGDLPGATSPDVRLIKHVTSTMGLTAKDLSANGNTVNMCGTGPNSSKCIKFPDANGNTYLTTLEGNGKIVLDAPTKVNGDLGLAGDWSVTSTDAQLCFKHGSNIVACLSDTTDKMRIYQNSDGNAPYTYFNNTGHMGSYNGTTATPITSP
jgi:hypothetical protein